MGMWMDENFELETVDVCKEFVRKWNLVWRTVTSITTFYLLGVLHCIYRIKMQKRFFF